MYKVEVIWNRAFNWVEFSNPVENFEDSKILAISIRDSGDGARVKRSRVVIAGTDEVKWEHD